MIDPVAQVVAHILDEESFLVNVGDWYWVPERLVGSTDGVEELVREGYAEVWPSTDQRYRFYRLTPEGRAWVAANPLA